MKIFCVGLLLLSFNGFTQERKDIEGILEQMESMGTFSPAQIKAAKERLNNLSDDELNSMVKKGHNAMRNPKLRKEAKEVIQQYKEQGGQLPSDDNITPE